MDTTAILTNVRFILFVSNTQETLSHDSLDLHFVDRSDGGLNTLGAKQKSDKSGFENTTDGFFYNFYIDSGFQDKDSIYLHYGNFGCSGCLTGAVCTETNTECLEKLWQYDCTIDGGSTDCYLCLDPMAT